MIDVWLCERIRQQKKKAITSFPERLWVSQGYSVMAQLFCTAQLTGSVWGYLIYLSIIRVLLIFGTTRGCVFSLLGNSLVDHLQELVHGEVFGTLFTGPFDYEVNDAKVVSVDKQHRDVVIGCVNHFAVHKKLPPTFKNLDKKSVRKEEVSYRCSLISHALSLYKKGQFSPLGRNKERFGAVDQQNILILGVIIFHL